MAAVVVAGVGLWLGSPAQAIPSFARQTGMPCSQCHVVGYGPALTAYGRQFKLNGYVWGDANPVVPPLALMIQGGFTHTSGAQPDVPAPHFATDDNLSVDQVSLFYGGRLSQHTGAFVQVTYDGEERHTHWDNLDIRYARTATVGNSSAVIGVSINNNPTVQDLWNSTPAWSFPYITSGLAPTPTAATMISGGLAQVAIGATVYAMIDDHLYLEAGAYRGLSDRWLRNTGLGPDDNLHLNGFAPYWRVAYQGGSQPDYFSVGAFGLNARLQPDPSNPDTDRFNDFGLDATYQYSDGGDHAVSANLSFVHEAQSLDASVAAGDSDNDFNRLNTVNFDIGYAYRQTWVASLGWFRSSGSTDHGLYAPGPLSGSVTGSPDSRGYLVQLECIPFGKLNSFARPWLNLRLGLQYTVYQQFNGSSANYDGAGRSATDNNTLFAFIWMAL